MNTEAALKDRTGLDVAPPRRVRRIVTGENAAGKSVFISDGPTPNFTANPSAPVAQVVWATGESRAEGADPAPAGHPFDFHSKGGSLLRIVDFPSDDVYDKAALELFLDANGVRDRSGNARHFWFHKTHSLDYAIVLEGEIYAMMDEGETLMRAGDVLVQRATNHSWSNRSGKPCRMAFVLLDLVQGASI